MTELALCRHAQCVTLGHGRSATAVRTMAAFTRRWEARGGIVLDVVTWPEEAASWLRQATRFAAADPDLWIMAGTARGWAQMTRRLLSSTPWQPGRTLAFAALGTQRAIDLVGAHNLQGLTGATADGGSWTVCNGNIRVARRLPSQRDVRLPPAFIRAWCQSDWRDDDNHDAYPHRAWHLVFRHARGPDLHAE